MKEKAHRNRTLELSKQDILLYRRQLKRLTAAVKLADIENSTICQNIFEVVDYLPAEFIDLLFVDPPYNLSKRFNQSSFKQMDSAAYEQWLDSWLSQFKRLLKPTASIYICGDWRSAAAIYNAAGRYFKVRNRITWEREKGRGAKANWKNCAEDIWFCTVADEYYFNLEAVKIKRRVLAPYKDEKGTPKDWVANEGQKYRITHPSNIWTHITVPFWSMPENTAHPTQKPEKLLAKLILASSRPNDLVCDPFLGSGTTSVVAKKLGRRYLGVEMDEEFCLLAQKRLSLAKKDHKIQGFFDGMFWERNSRP